MTTTELGIGARIAFAFAVGHGLQPSVASFGVAHRIGARPRPSRSS